LHLIDDQPKEAVASLLRIIAYHDRLARRAEDKDLEESWHYHEASRKDAKDRLALYEKRWLEQAAVGKSDAPAAAAEVGSCPNQSTAAVIVNAEKGWLAREKGCSPSFAEVAPPLFGTLAPDAHGQRA